MNKFFKILNIIFILVYIFFVFYLVLSWNNMQDVIGVHFSLANNNNYLNFDVYDKKIYALYPYIINGIILFVILFTSKKIDRFKMGIKLNIEGERVFKTYILVFTYIVAICAFIFFSSWMYCVINQKTMHILIPQICSMVAMINLFTLIPSVISIKLIYNKKKN